MPFAILHYNNLDFCKEIVAEYEDEIRESIIDALL